MNPIKPLKITETVLRDAHQSLLATRMRTEDMLPIASQLDAAGYFSLEMWGGATFDSCLRFLNENPWERVRQLKKLMPKTPFQMLLRGQNLVGYRHYADDVVERFVKKSVDVGIDIFRIFDALNDFRNIKTAVAAVKKCGKIMEGAISYTVSPVHNLELYLKMARQLEDMGSDILCIKDMAGLLTPGVTRVLISEIKKVVKLPVHLHTHATTGLVGMNVQCAIDAGVDIVDTAISPLAMGTSQFATECVVAALKGTPRDTGMDLQKLYVIADHFREVRKRYSQYESDFKGVDIKILDSQIPGGMISNMENQLREQNALDKLDEVLREVPRVRKDMGYPPLVTPTSQIVGSQATLNILTGERYKIITKETRECVLGRYGKLPGPIDQALLNRVVENDKVIECRPADLLEPEWERVVKECEGKVADEEDLLSYAIFPKVALKFFESRSNPAVSAAGKAETNGSGGKADVAKPSTPPAAAAPQAAVPAAPVGGAVAYAVKINGQTYAVEITPVGGGQAFALAPVAAAVPLALASGAAVETQAAKENVAAPLPGAIVSIKVKEGVAVKAGDALMVMESMKMETEIKCSTQGVVGAIFVAEGAHVNTGDPLIRIV